jgi:hypothetical protein
MKTKILAAVYAAGIVLSFTSCLSFFLDDWLYQLNDPYVWDATIPEEESAEAYFTNVFPTHFNGLGFEREIYYARLPAGNARISCNLNWKT